MKEKIYLVYPPFNFVGMPPLGLAYIKSTLKFLGDFDAEIIDLNIQLYQHCIDLVINSKLDSNITKNWNSGAYSYRQCVASILFDTRDRLEEGNRRFARVIHNFFRNWLYEFSQLRPPIVGISVTDSSFMSALYLARELKTRSPGTHIIFGGPLMITQFVTSYMREFHFIDSIICGEGEISFVKLCKNIIGTQKESSSIPGLYSRKFQNLSSKELKFEQELDNLPFPDFSGSILYDYIGRFYPDILGKPTLPILASRGCSWGKCTFCSDPFIWPGYRCRSGLNVVNEIISQSSTYKVFNLMFCDLSLNNNINQLENICDLLIASGRDFIWECMNRVIRMPEGILEKMRRSGCRAIFLGIESLSDSILRKMKKGANKKMNVQMMHDVIRNNIFLRFNLIKNFPGDTISDVKEELNFLKENESWLKGNCEIFISPYTLTYGSPIWYDLKSFGISKGYTKYKDKIPLIRQKSIPFYEYELIPSSSDSKKNQDKKENLWREIQFILDDWNGSIKENDKNDFYLDLKDFVVIYKSSYKIILEDEILRSLFLHIVRDGEKTKREIIERFYYYNMDLIKKKLDNLLNLKILDYRDHHYISKIAHWTQDKRVNI